MPPINWARLCLSVAQSPISVRGRGNEGHIHHSHLNMGQGCFMLWAQILNVHFTTWRACHFICSLVHMVRPEWVFLFLVKQIQKVVLALGDYMGATCHACIGGTNVRNDVQKLQADVPHIVVGTPGRVFDMLNRRYLCKYTTRSLKLQYVTFNTYNLDRKDKESNDPCVFRSLNTL